VINKSEQFTTSLERKVSKVEEAQLQVLVLARVLSLEAQTLADFQVAPLLSVQVVVSAMALEGLAASSLQIHRKYLSSYFFSLIVL